MHFPSSYSKYSQLSLETQFGRSASVTPATSWTPEDFCWIPYSLFQDCQQKTHGTPQKKNGIQQISAGVQKKFCLISLLYRLPSIYKNIQLLEFSFSVGNYWNYEPTWIGWDSITQTLKSVQMPPVEISCSTYGICWTPYYSM